MWDYMKQYYMHLHYKLSQKYGTDFAKCHTDVIFIYRNINYGHNLSLFIDILY